MKIENPIVRFSIFFSVTFVITFIMNVLMIHTESIHPHFLMDTILTSIYISIIFPSIIFLDDVRKRESNLEFKKTRNKFLVSIFLFLWIVNTIPHIIEKHLMGTEIIWSKSLFLGLALAIFSIPLICLADLVQNRTKKKI
jgi:hypothetical protein